MEGEQKSGTVIFLDWDDTLLCSSYLSGEGIRLDTDINDQEELLEQLKDFETHVIDVLKLALSFGEVTIVTNAENGWVELSAKKFLPNVVPLIEKLHVISARSTYEKSFPDSPLQWKLSVFQQQLGKIGVENNPRVIKSVLSFGDSYVEREAILKATKFLDCKTKSIKFAERPSIEQLKKQLELVANCFEDIVSHQENLDLCMSLSVSPPPKEEVDEKTQTDEEQDFGNINMAKTLHISPDAQVCE
jgi:hypothetical protein